MYEYQNLMDYNLWMAFSDDFENFTLDTFKKLPIETKAGLRIHLLQRGVFVSRHSKNQPLGKVLFDIL